jgi:hypothetical protein
MEKDFEHRVTSARAILEVNLVDCLILQRAGTLHCRFEPGGRVGAVLASSLVVHPGSAFTASIRPVSIEFSTGKDKPPVMETCILHGEDTKKMDELGAGMKKIGVDTISYRDIRKAAVVLYHTRANTRANGSFGVCPLRKRTSSMATPKWSDAVPYTDATSGVADATISMVAMSV